MRQSIVHVALVVRDYDEAIEFYTKKLHFSLIEDTYQPEQNKRWVVVFSSRLNRNDITTCESSHR
jgi:catechol 2,3-dioxygenase-like lactoylglutathione lyase family enzyme